MASAWGLALRIPPVAAKQHQGPASLGDRACQVVTRPLGSSGGLDKKKCPATRLIQQNNKLTNMFLKCVNQHGKIAAIHH